MCCYIHNTYCCLFVIEFVLWTNDAVYITSFFFYKNNNKFGIHLHMFCVCIMLDKIFHFQQRPQVIELFSENMTHPYEGTLKLILIDLKESC